MEEILKNLVFSFIRIATILFIISINLFSEMRPYEGPDFDQVSHRLKQEKSGTHGSGYVQRKPDKLNKLTENLVKKGLEYIEKNGLENTIILINNKPRKFKEFKTYLFIIDPKGNILAHSGNPNFAGKNMLTTKDSRGHLFIQEYINNSNEYGSINYMNLLTLADDTRYIYNFVCLEVLENNLIIGAVAKP